MAALVQSNFVNAASATSTPVPYTSAITKGDLLVVTHRCGQPTATLGVSDTAGNIWNLAGTWATAFGSADFSVGVWWAIANSNQLANANTVTFTQSGAVQTMRCVVTEFSGVNAIDGSAVETTASTASPASGNLTTTQAVELLFLICANHLGGSTMSLNSPGTGGGTPANIDVIDQKFLVGYSITTAAGSMGCNVTWSASPAAANFITAIVAFKLVVSNPPPPAVVGPGASLPQWNPANYQAKAAVALAGGLTLTRLIPPSYLKGPEVRRDQYWGLTQYWAKQYSVIVGIIPAQPLAGLKVLDSAYRRDPNPTQVISQLMPISPGTYLAPPPVPAVYPPAWAMQLPPQYSLAITATLAQPGAPPPPVGSEYFRRDQFWSPRDFFVPSAQSLPMAVTLAVSGLSTILGAGQRRDQYWGLNNYWLKPPNIIAIGVTLARPGAPPPPIGSEYRRDQHWGLTNYWTRPPVSLAIGYTRGPVPPIPAVGPEYFRRDQFWTLNSFWTAPPKALAGGSSLGQLGAPPPPNGSEYHRRDQHWTLGSYWTRPVVVMTAQLTLAQPGAPPPPIGPEYRRDQPWSLGSYWTRPVVSLATGLTIRAAEHYPPKPIYAEYRRDQFWGLNNYWTRPPVSLPAGVSLARPGGPPPPLGSEYHRRDQYWNALSYQTSPPLIIVYGPQPDPNWIIRMPVRDFTVTWQARQDREDC